MCLLIVSGRREFEPDMVRVCLSRSRYLGAGRLRIIRIILTLLQDQTRPAHPEFRSLCSFVRSFIRSNQPVDHNNEEDSNSTRVKKRKPSTRCYTKLQVRRERKRLLFPSPHFVKEDSDAEEELERAKVSKFQKRRQPSFLF